MTERLTISRLGHRGDGIADTPDGPVYVPYTLPGEMVEVEPCLRPSGPPASVARRAREPGAHPAGLSAFRRLRRLPDPALGLCALPRLETRPRCRGASASGARRAGRRPHRRSGEGRRRAVFHARRASHGVMEVGFAAWRAHQIVGIDRCPVLAPSLHGALPAAWAIAEAIGPGKPLDIQVTATDAALDVDVRGSGPLGARHTAALARLADSHRLARLTRHGELIVQRAAPTVRMGKATVALPPGAFLQATAEGEAILARLVSEHVGKAKAVADLFCGVGPFALRLAERARVTAADADAGAVAALRQAAKTPGLKPIAAEARDLFRRPLAPDELKSLRCGRVRSAASRRRGAGAPACGVTRSAGRRGVVQCRDVRARCTHSLRWRLPPDVGDAGRPVSLLGACGDRRAVRALAQRSIPLPPQRRCHITSPIVQEMRGALAAAGMTRAVSS